MSIPNVERETPPTISDDLQIHTDDLQIHSILLQIMDHLMKFPKFHLLFILYPLTRKKRNTNK